MKRGQNILYFFFLNISALCKAGGGGAGEGYGQKIDSGNL